MYTTSLPPCYCYASPNRLTVSSSPNPPVGTSRGVIGRTYFLSDDDTSASDDRIHLSGP